MVCVRVYWQALGGVRVFHASCEDFCCFLQLRLEASVQEFFDTLLNGNSRSVSPDLASLRGKFETYFAANEGKRSKFRCINLKAKTLYNYEKNSGFSD